MTFCVPVVCAQIGCMLKVCYGIRIVFCHCVASLLGFVVSTACSGDGVTDAVAAEEISTLGVTCFVEWNKSGGGYGVSSNVEMRYKAVNMCWYTP